MLRDEATEISDAPPTGYPGYRCHIGSTLIWEAYLVHIRANMAEAGKGKPADDRRHYSFLCR